MMRRSKYPSAASSLAVSIALMFAAPSAHADEFFWNNESGHGGVFGDGYNWDDPYDPEVPGENDVAIFDIPGIFTVEFLQEHETDRVLIRSGLVTFSFGPDVADYRLLNADPGTPGVVIGVEGGDLAGLVLAESILKATCFDLGHAADSLGMMAVTGESARFNYEKQFRVGGAGIGFLDISDISGILQTGSMAATFDIGSKPGSFGRVTVGPDVLWFNNKFQSVFAVGKSGVGELTVGPGAMLACKIVIVGDERGSMGTADLDGGNWSNDRMDIGRTGLGSLSVRNGGSVTANLTTIGTYLVQPPDFAYGEGGVGSVIVTGDGSSFEADDLFIGYEAIGKLTIAEDGLASVSNNVTIAFLPGFDAPDSAGTLVCSEGGRIEVGGDLIRGAGDALITIELGAADDYFDYPAIAATGSTDDFDAEVVLTDEFVPQVGWFHIAHADGAMGVLSFSLPDLPPPLGWEVLQDDHDVTLQIVENPPFGGGSGVSSGFGFAGSDLGGQRPRRLNYRSDFLWNNACDRGQFDDAAFWNEGSSGVPGDEDNAIFDAAGIFDVDFNSEAVTDRLLVRSGMPTFHLSPEAGYTALNALPITPGIAVGVGDGDATALIVEGGPMHGVFTDLAYDPDAVGFLTLQGPDTSLTNDQHLHVGHAGAGILRVDGGSIVANGHGMIASAGGAYGQATVTGPSTQWTCDGSLAVGKNGFGELTISDGANVMCMDAIIAQYLGSMGSVTVSGEGSSWYIDGTLDVGMTGFGSLLIEDGGSVFNHTFATLATYPGEPWYIPGAGGYADATVTGGGSNWTIDGDLYLGYMSYTAELVIACGATVDVTGTLVLEYMADTSTLTLSRNGAIHIGEGCEIGNYGNLRFELGEGDYQDPAIDVIGSVNGAPAQVQLAEGYAPQWGDVFHIIHTGAGVGEIVFTTPDLPPPLGWQVLNDGFDVKLIIANSLLGDLNGDGKVNIDDLFIILAYWGTCDGCPEDLNGDGKINIDDLFIVLANWT